MKKFLCILLTIALAALLAAPASAAGETLLVPTVTTRSVPFRDARGLWCKDAVSICWRTGLLSGRTATKFDARSSLTYGQMMVIAARLYTRLTGGKSVAAPAAGEPWYLPSFRLLTTLAAQQKQPLLLPDSSGVSAAAAAVCTRQNFAGLLLLVLKSARISLPVLNSFTVSPPDLESTQAEFTLYQAGILSGTDSTGAFRGSAGMTRGQMAAILCRVVAPARRLTFSITGVDQCRDILGVSPDAVLLTVDGKALTAEQCSNALCSALRAQSAQTTGDLTAVIPAATASLKTDLAVETLAAKEQISLTEQEQAGLVSALPGYRGLTVSGRRWVETHALLWNKLLSLYESRYGGLEPGLPFDDTPTAGHQKLDETLAQLTGAMTVQESPALAAISLSAAQARLLKSADNIGR